MEFPEILILDGGLATELEARGHDLNNGLWSAKLLLESPDEIRAVHLAYLNAGADCITSASYQATLAGFVQAGIGLGQAEQLIRSSVWIARTARDEFWTTATHENRIRPFVAASVGPYGAYLGNGAEYTGDYGIANAQLLEFHRRRWQLLSEERPDIMLCETIPSLVEATALVELAESSQLPTWMSFSCRDERSISDGTPINECAQITDACDQIEAIGVNCTAPRFVAGLIDQIHSVTDKRILVFPNSGESFDAQRKCWTGESDVKEFVAYTGQWRKAGASIIGGCCRTTPKHIRAIRNAVGTTDV